MCIIKSFCEMSYYFLGIHLIFTCFYPYGFPLILWKPQKHLENFNSRKGAYFQYFLLMNLAYRLRNLLKEIDKLWVG